MKKPRNMNVGLKNMKNKTRSLMSVPEGGCETFCKDQSHGDEKREEAYKMIESANITMSL